MTRQDAASDTGAERATHLARDQARPLLAYFARRIETNSDAADLVAETLLTVWRRRDSLPHDPIEARMWLFGVARRTLFRYRRTWTRRFAVADRLREHLETRPETAVDRGVAVDVEKALATLPHTDREIIRLVHWDGFTLAEAASILGMRPAATRMRYGRARARLRVELEAYGDAEA